MIQDKFVNIPAGTAVTLIGVGQFIGLVEVSDSAAELRVTATNIDGQQILSARMQEGERVTLDRMFNQVRIENEGGADLTVVALIGSGRFDSGRLVGNVQVDAPTQLIANPALTAAAMPVLQSIAANSSRKNILLSAPVSNVGAWWVGGVSGSGMPVFAGQSVVLDVTAQIDLIADNAADVIYSLEQRA